MLSFKKFFESSDQEDYRGSHRAPGKSDSTAPLWDLTKIYPDDIYSINAARYYGDGSPFDNMAINIIKQFKNKPNRKLKIYRAVPNLNSELEKELKALGNKVDDAIGLGRFYRKINWSEYRELGFIVDDKESEEKYIDYLRKKYDELEKIVKSKKININPGDWITTVKEYAKEHGEAHLRGNYKILSKIVFARDLYTDANSIFEFGYDPQPVVKI